MQIKTYTALITVAVEDGDKVPDFETLEQHFITGILGSGSSVRRVVQAAYVSVSGGDNVKPACTKIGEILYLEGDDKSMLHNGDQYILDAKRRHQRLRDRHAGTLPVPEVALNEGSDCD